MEPRDRAESGDGAGPPFERLSILDEGSHLDEEFAPDLERTGYTDPQVAWCGLTEAEL